MLKYFLIIIAIFNLNHYAFADSLESITAPSVFLMDYETGRILYQHDPDKVIPPASMTKMITMYVALSELAKSETPLDSTIQVTASGSALARPAGSSLMYLEEGQVLTLNELFTGLAVASGNDAAYALAEYISGDADAFVNLMNDYMSKNGFEALRFVDPDGWSENNMATAREIAGFARLYIQDYPFVLQDFHSLKDIAYPQDRNLRKMEQMPVFDSPHYKQNTNWLLGVVEGVDGLKTGYIPEGGFNFTATALRGKTRLIAVVMGIQSSSFQAGLESRAEQARILLEWGFENYQTVHLDLPYIIKIPVYRGDSSYAEGQLSYPAAETLTPEESEQLLFLIEIPAYLENPVARDQIIGEVAVFGGAEIQVYDLRTNYAINNGNSIQRIIDSITLFLGSLFPGILRDIQIEKRFL